MDEPVDERVTHSAVDDDTEPEPVDLDDLQAASEVLAETLSERSVAEMLIERRELWNELDRATNQVDELRSTVNNLGGSGTAPPSPTLPHDGTASGEFTAVRSAVETESRSIATIEKELQTGRSDLVALQQKLKNLKIMVFGGAGALVLVLIVLISSVL